MNLIKINIFLFLWPAQWHLIIKVAMRHVKLNEQKT